MLLRCTCTICPGFELLTVGESCFYLLRDGTTTCLFDCGGYLQAQRLVERLKALQPAVEKIDYLFVTQPTSYRIGGLPYLRRYFPEMQVLSSGPLKRKIASVDTAQRIYDSDCEITQAYQAEQEVMPLESYRELLQPDQTFPDSETIQLTEGIRIHCFLTPGHTDESVSYRIQPYDFIVTDQVVGYFRGKDFAAPGADSSLAKSLQTIKILKDIQIEGLCLPFAGVLTGTLVQRHLNGVIQNTEDLMNECASARAEKVSDQEVFNSLQEAFYTTKSADLSLRAALNATLKSIWQQVLKA